MKSKYHILQFITLIFICSMSVGQNNHSVVPPPVNHQLDPYNPEYVPGELLLKIKDEIETQLSNKSSAISIGILSIDTTLNSYTIEDIIPLYNEKMILTAHEKSNPINQYTATRLRNVYKVKFDSGIDVFNIISKLSKCDEVEYAEPNFLIYSMDVIPNDPIYQTGVLWHIDTIRAPAAWDSTTCDTSQIICIIDTGVDWDHPDLDDNIWTNWDEIPGNGSDDDGNGFADDIRGWDFINNDNDPNDDNGHGTHVAGLAAAETDNSIGVSGIAWHAKVMPVKVLQSSGVGNSADFAQGILYAYNSGATILNMSLGSYGESLTVKNALEYAYLTSVLIAAAGNDELPIFFPMFPACYSSVIGVQASDFYNEFTDFTNYDDDGPIESSFMDGKNYEIKAPGLGLYSTFPGGSYHALSGSSMACPLVSGSVALLKSHFQGISTEQIFVRLIQGADTGALNIHKSLIIEPVPDLYFNNYVIVDTIEGGDNDGIPDAGETIELYLNLKNAGAWADSVWGILRIGEFEDTTVAKVIDSTCYIGDMSAYSYLSGESNPFVIQIDPDVVNNRDIVFEYEIGSINSPSKKDQIIITVENGEELLGIMDSTLILTPDKLWLVNGSFKVTGSLIILPGTTMQLNKRIINQGTVIGEGTADSIIVINGPGLISGGLLTFKHTLFDVIDSEGSMSNNSGSTFSYCVFEKSYYAYYVGIINDCIFKDSYMSGYHITTMKRCNFENIYISGEMIWDYTLLTYCNFSRIYGDWPVYKWEIIRGENTAFYSNNFTINHHENFVYRTLSSEPYEQIPPQYWGTTDTSKIDEMIFDFYVDPSLAIVNYQPILAIPSDSAHGMVWKVHVNDVDPQENYLDPIGVETVKFDVYFNRPMDTTYTPWLTFGIREPHTQHSVSDNSSWNIDSTIWTAYYTTDLTTGDGLNIIRVSGAMDTEGFEIPIEDNERFTFIIQAAQAASLNFTATPGIGKVILNWPVANTSDIMGYNLYRFFNLTDTTYSDTTLINTQLIIDTTYTDYDVIPDTTYHYYYTVLGTDMQESDISKSVAAIPLNAANGDANGDMIVNVLDITSIVSYMIGQNPQPFLFEAADVNGDLLINVLDLIGVVGIINGSKSAPLNNLISLNKQSAWLFSNRHGITLESKGNLAAIQFELTGILPDEFAMLSEVLGFEFSYAQKNEKIIGVLYSLSGKTIPDGIRQIIRFSKEIENIEISNAIGGDYDGRYVPVFYKNDESFPEEKLLVYSSPNPFSSSTQIHFETNELSEITIKIYNLSGYCIKNYYQSIHPGGKYSKTWDGRNKFGHKIENGIYFCQIHTRSLINFETRKANLKLVLIQ